MDVPEISSIIVGYLTTRDVMKCILVCRRWQMALEGELWRIVLSMNKYCRDGRSQDNYILSVLYPRYDWQGRGQYTGGLSSTSTTVDDYRHINTGTVVHRRLDETQLKAKGGWIRSILGLGLMDQKLLMAVAQFCGALRQLEIVVACKDPKERSFLGRVWQSHGWRKTRMSTTKEDFCAMEMFFSKLAAARVDPEIRPLTGGRPQPRPRPAYGLESVCIVMEDINGDYRMLQALRHLPNLGRLIVHGSSQWVNNVVNGDQSTLGQVSLPPYYLTDLWALIESCPVLEDMCLLNLGLDGKEGEMEMEEEEDHDKQHVAECFEKVEDVIVQSPPALLGSVEEAKVSTLVPKQSRKGRLKALTMQIPEERPHVYQTLLQRTGFSLQKLDLTLVDWCMNRLQATERLEALVRLCPRLEVLALRFRPDVVVQAIHRHKQEIQKSALSEEDAQGKKVNERAYVEATNKKVEKWSQSFRYNSAPVSYCGVDVARLAEAFPETLLSLELVDVRMETTNMVQVDPLRSPAVSGIKSLKILYRHTACPIRELEHILATFGHLTRLEMGVPHAECVRGSGFVPILLTPTMQDHDTMMQALSKSHRWACQETLQFLDVSRMGLYQLPGYCEMFLERVGHELQQLQSLCLDMRCFRVQRSRQDHAEVPIMPSSTTTTARARTHVPPLPVDVSMPQCCEFPQLKQLSIRGACDTMFDTLSNGTERTWNEPIGLEEMGWIRHGVLKPHTRLFYCHYGEWRSITSEQC